LLPLHRTSRPVAYRYLTAARCRVRTAAEARRVGRTAAHMDSPRRVGCTVCRAAARTDDRARTAGDMEGDTDGTEDDREVAARRDAARTDAARRDAARRDAEDGMDAEDGTDVGRTDAED